MKKGKGMTYFLVAAMVILSLNACGKKASEETGVPETKIVIETKAENVSELDGSLKSFTDGVLVVTNSNGEDISFKITSKASFNCKNMLAGDNLVVSYEGSIVGTDTSKATVVSVDDKGESTVIQQEMVGTLEEYSTNSLKLKTNDGDEYTFSIVGAQQEYKNGIESGNWIHVTYTGKINGTDTSGVKVVKITDDSDNIKEEQAKVTIKDIDEEVWATASVNVRDNYSTDANVLGVLAVNDEVTKTGECDNGWSQIRYNGNTGYVYGDYLTTTRPDDGGPGVGAGADDGTTYDGGPGAGAGADDGTTATTDDTLRDTSGYVVSLAADGTLVIDMDNVDYAFNIANAQQNYANGLLVGNEVTVTYAGDLSDSIDAVVSSVTDTADNSNNQSRITGTISSASMNGIALVTDDNAVLAIATDGAAINAQGLQEGSRVTVTLNLDQTVDSSNMFYALVVDPA